MIVWSPPHLPLTSLTAAARRDSRSVTMPVKRVLKANDSETYFRDMDILHLMFE